MAEPDPNIHYFRHTALRYPVVNIGSEGEAKAPERAITKEGYDHMGAPERDPIWTPISWIWSLKGYPKMDPILDPK